MTQGFLDGIVQKSKLECMNPIVIEHKKPNVNGKGEIRSDVVSRAIASSKQESNKHQNP
jgi:hypothetical protein